MVREISNRLFASATYGIAQQCQSAKLAHLTDCCFGRFIKTFVLVFCSISIDNYRHCNCRLVALPVAATEAILTADYRFVWSLFSQCLLHAPNQMCQPTRDLQPTFNDVVPCENLVVPQLLIIAESQSWGMNKWWIITLIPTTNQQWCLV